MSITIPISEIRQAGNNLTRIAERISRLSNLTSDISNAIGNCYMNGGVGNRTYSAVSRLQNEFVLIQAKGDALRAAADIYENKENQLEKQGHSTANTIHSGYRVSWTDKSAIKMILASGVASSGVVFPFLSTISILTRIHGKTEEFTIFSPDITSRDEKPNYIELKKTGDIFYSNVDVVDGKKPYYNLCPKNAAAMVVEAVADPNKVAELVKSESCSNLREYAVKKGYAATGLAKELGLNTKLVKIGGTDGVVAENAIKEHLNDSTSKVGYLWFGAGKQSYGHAVMVYLDENGSLMVNDPGGSESWGKNKSFKTQCNYWLSTGRVINDMIIVDVNQAYN